MKKSNASIDFFAIGYDAYLHRYEVEVMNLQYKVRDEYGKEALESFKSGVYQAKAELGQIGMPSDILNKFIFYNVDEEVIQMIDRNRYKTTKSIKRLKRSK